nr:putative disease resistance protein RGA3 [Malus domestica]XP_028958342.1 putative disease resistance protein RGA3 [Malus domestica]XP_028958343.1 putative disease resistance protein RGA3 [Malus domestica]XP_028958344.1 putative disease resistance protein RGA3 [Malus domestica]XP_028958345.1 putative disease resistance protein RGA3 [Malus domestica]XP_028958346.1 putative disease resistance protein RGA3 [Malus domestica]
MAQLSSFTAEGILAKAVSLSNEPLVRSWELEEKLKSLHQTLSMIQDITREAAEQPQDPREAVASWVQKLKDVANDADDVLEEINYEVLRHKHEIQNHLKRKVLNFFSFSNPVAFRLKTACKIKSINASLVDLASQASSMALFSKNIDATSQAMKSTRETNSSIGNEIIVGRDDAVSNIVATLTNSKDQESLSVMAIVGMPGLGKTTLAKLVYNEDAISQQFDKKIWIYVSKTFDVDLILSRILECVNCGTVDIQSQEAVLKSLQEQLAEKRCLLVLDDVWNEDSEEWSKLMICLSELRFARGSTILVTTRSSKVATITETLSRYDLGFLSEDECWSILKGRAFVDNTAPTDPDLETVGRDIAKKCAGLPSVAKVFGGMLRSKNGADQWSAILQSKICDSPEAKEIIISELKLSLDNLKFPFLKQCFTYCSMFKKGSEIERDDLIQLWMAQGLLCPSSENSDLEMEDIGTEYFHILLQNSLLQDLTKDEFGVVAKCKMHALVHDFAEHVSKFESATSDSNETVGTLKIRHASHIPTLVLQSIPKKSLRGLRSLFSNSEVPSHMLPRFRGLHVLNLYNADIKELPISIGKLKQLRYLNVSRTKIEALPKSVGKLHNLQTLRMEHCRRLKVFSMEMGDLINLRHIYFGPVQKKKRANFGWYRESHVRVGQLTSLRTMPYFIVSPDGTSRGIEELAGLNHLKGELAIYDLEHVRDGEEAKKSNLVGKKNIRKLSLIWGEEMRPCNNSEEDVLQGLQPHPNLEILEIRNFMGAQFPSWKPHNNLKEIRLFQCDVCEEAPMLGHLPSLMHLEFNTMCNLKRLGDEFYGYYDIDDAMKTKALFPTLKTFRIIAALNLTEWIEPPMVKEQQISVFPRLEELDLVECPQIRNFPDHFAFLRKLEMSICHELSNLTSLVEKCTSLQNLEICSCDKLRSLSLFGLTSIRKLLFSSRGGKLTSTSHHSGLELYTGVSLEELSIKCPSLENLEISRCDNLISISIHGVTSLRGLEISSCGGLISMDLQSLPECYIPLEVLSLRSCRNLDSISSLHGCTSLRELTIEDCDELKTCAFIGLESCTSIRALHVNDFQRLRQYAVDGLDMSLIEELTIYKSPKLICISNHGLMTLRKLVLIASCGLELSIGSSTTLEELSLQDCTSLGSLCIDNCESLRHVSVDGLETLTLLEELTMRNCPRLTFIPITPSLRGLVIEGCGKLSSLPRELKHCNALERLKISGCRNLECIPISDVFPPSLGQFVIEDCAQLSSLQGRHESLKELSIVNCPELRWSSVAERGKSLTALRKLVIASWSEPELDIDFISTLDEISLHDCTSLGELRVVYCQNLRQISLHDCTSLGELRIRNCQNLRHLVRDGWGIQTALCLKVLEIYKCSNLEALPSLDNLTSLGKLSIVECDGLTGLPSGLSSCTSLGNLRIEDCQNLKALPSLDNLTSLGELSIVECDGLTGLPSGLSSCTSLVELKIERCKKLISLAGVDVTSLQSLSSLTILDCKKLRYLPTGLHTLTRLEIMQIGGLWQELDSFPVSQIPSSNKLAIVGWPKLKSLPQIINHSTNPVTVLAICTCDGLETLPEWLGDLTSLAQLSIGACKNLKSLPSAQDMQRLTKLDHLLILGCPILKETCASGTGTEWPKISHIPKIKIHSDEDEDEDEDEDWILA